jgi:hypothetical protein
MGHIVAGRLPAGVIGDGMLGGEVDLHGRNSSRSLATWHWKDKVAESVRANLASYYKESSWL